MFINKYYRYSKCEKLSQIESLVSEESRHFVLYRAIRMVCDLMLQKVDYESILIQLSDFLAKSYKREWFTFSWQKEQLQKNDIFCIRRFFDWLGKDIIVLAANVPVSVSVASTLSDGSSILEDTVPLVVQFPSGRYGAILLFFKKADKSVKGKSVHTAIGTDLHAMVAKYCLEEQYPGICVSSVYLLSEDDTNENMLPKLRVTDTKKSNVFSQTFSGYFENGVFHREYFLEVLNSVIKQPFPNACYECSKKMLCEAQSKSYPVQAPAAISQLHESSYMIPDYTDSQKLVINHKDGPMLVCAGPGSGKTATLVGRVKELCSSGIPAEVQLVITFTNEAAGELLTRCSSFCDSYSMPKVSTINALGYEILRTHQHLIGSKVNLLTAVEQLQLVKSLLSVTPPLYGISYTQEYGKQGLYKTVCKKLDKYLAAKSPAEFFQAEPGLGTDFQRFAEQYRSIVIAQGYISFDEQVTLCNKLFLEHPEVLSIYQHLYRYVMVDEYQDINADQAKFIYQIAGHRNLVVVGDDDQSVYGFRGASNQYMIQFPKDFPEAKTVVLKDNFRSTQPLVNAAQSLIANNKVRIPKKISCTRQGGTAPVVVNGATQPVIEEIVAQCLQRGYSYGDIAVLSTKNAPLEALHKSLRVPNILAKSYLRDDFLFLIMYDILCLYKNVDDNERFYHFLLLNDISDIKKESGLSIYQSFLRQGYTDIRDYLAYGDSREDDCIYNALRLVSNMFYLLDTNSEAMVFLQCVSYRIGMENCASVAAIKNMIEKQGLKTNNQLQEYMQFMVQFEDETRVEIDNKDSILLITSHESKGREFPIVIMFDNYKESSEELRRLFYVAMTRAKDGLYILHDPACNNHFLQEFSSCQKLEM